MRNFLPLAIVPLDSFGARIVANLKETIERCEPELISSGGVDFFDQWSDAVALPLAESLEKMIGQASQPTEGEYQYPFSLSKAIIIPVGSLSLSQGQLIQALVDLACAMFGKRFGDFLQIMPVLDISYFVNDLGMGTPPAHPSLLQQMGNALKPTGWHGYVYLIDNYSEKKQIACNRDQIEEAIGLLLQGMTLGDHWEVSQHDWLQAEDAQDEIRFASFAVLGVESLQKELINYFSHVSFYQTLDWAKKQAEDEALIEPAREAAIGDAGELEESPAAQNSENPNLRAAPAFPRLRPRLNQTKAAFRGAFGAAITDFDSRFSSWFSALRLELVQLNERLSRVSKDILSAYESQAKEKVEQAAGKPHFLFALNRLRENLLYQARSEPFSSEEDAGLSLRMLDQKAHPSLNEAQEAVRESISRLPNPISYIFVLIIVALLQAVFTRRLFDLWQADPTFKEIVFISIQLAWLVGTLYGTWRYSAWVVEREIRTRVANNYKQATQEINHGFSLLREQQISHWNRKNHASAVSLALRQAKRIETACAYLQLCADQEREAYPYPDIDWNLIHHQDGTFRFFLETREDLDRIIEDSVKAAPAVTAVFNRRSQAVSEALEREDYQRIAEILRETTQTVYESATFLTMEDVNRRLQKVTENWSSQYSAPLVNLALTPGATPSRSRLYCVCPETWHAICENIFRSDTQATNFVPLRPKDRMYLFRVTYDIPLSMLKG